MDILSDRFEPSDDTPETLPAARPATQLKPGWEFVPEVNFIRAVRDGQNDPDDVRMARCNDFVLKRYGLDTDNGSILNNSDSAIHQPFTDPASYETAVINLIRGGYETIASQKYRDLMASERTENAEERRAAQLKLLEVDEQEEYIDSEGLDAGVLGGRVKKRPRPQADVDRDLLEAKQNVYAENFIALYEAYRPDLSEKGETFVRNFVKNGRLSISDRSDFAQMVRENPKDADLVAFLCHNAKSAKSEVFRDAGRGAWDMLKKMYYGAGEKIGQGFYRLGASFEALDYGFAGSRNEILARMTPDERAEYDRLASSMRPEEALSKVGAMMQNRKLDELLAEEDRIEQRRVELALEDLSARRQWDYGYGDRALIGVATTLPYMGITAIPYAGWVVNISSHMQDVEDEIVRQGGDPRKAAAARFVGAVAWAAVEKVQLKGFGRDLSRLEKAVAWNHLVRKEWQFLLGDMAKALPAGAANWAWSTANESIQEGIQGAIEAIEVDLGLDKSAGEMFRDSLSAAWNDTVESIGSMGITELLIPGAGAAIRAPFQRRRALDNDSVAAYIKRSEQLRHMIDAEEMGESADDPSAAERRKKTIDKLSGIWYGSQDHTQAMRQFVDMGFSESQAMDIARYFDLESALKTQLEGDVGKLKNDLASLSDAYGAETDPAKQQELRGQINEILRGLVNAEQIAATTSRGLPVGNDTTYDPVSLMRLINPGIKVEETVMGPENSPAYRVSWSMTRPDGAVEERTFTIVNDYSTPAIDTEGFAASVQKATENTPYAISSQDYLNLPHDEKAAFLLAHDLKTGGFFKALDAEGSTLWQSDGLVNIMRGESPFVRKGGNWTLAHETVHAVSSFAREMQLLNDADIETMRRIFGNPILEGESWNEEAMADAFADYLQDKFDFTPFTPDERTLLERIFSAVWNFFVRLAKHHLIKAQPTLSEAREEIFEALRRGDLRGLSRYAGIDFQNESAEAQTASETASADQSPKSGAEASRQRAEAQEHTKTPPKAQTPSSPAPAAPKEASSAAGVEIPTVFPKRTGNRIKIYTPDYSMSVNAEMMWVPLADLVESTADRDIQMRDRSRNASDKQVYDKTQKGVFKAFGLFPSTESDRGAPIVGGGLNIISGHGRKRMLEALARAGRYDEYLKDPEFNEELAKNGITPAPEGMKYPVLVSRIVSAISHDDLAKFAERSNRSGMQGRSAAEFAESDAKELTPELMRLYNPDKSGNLLAASNRGFMFRFLEKVGATELTNADGTPAPEAALRVQRAMMTKIFGNSDNIRSIIRYLMEGSDLSLGELRGALIREAGNLIAMQRFHGSYNIVPSVANAAQEYIAWRVAQQKQPSLTLEDHFDQGRLFDMASPLDTALALLLENERFGQTIAKYSDLVARQTPDAQTTLAFVEAQTPLQLLGRAERELFGADNAVTPDPESETAKTPMQTPPASSLESITPPPSAPETKDPIQVAQDVITPPEPTTFTPVPNQPGTAVMPESGDASSLLRPAYDVQMPPSKPSAQDLAGRGLGISRPPKTAHGQIFPHFQGNKTEMADRTSQALRKTMTKAEREHYTTIVDYFGGGGCWGLYHALENFPNANRLVINEFDPDRLNKIRLLQEEDGAVADRVRNIVLPSMPQLASATNNSSSPATIANAARKIYMPLLTDASDRAAMQAFIDCASTLLATSKDEAGNPINDTTLGVERALTVLREDGRKAKEAADRYKARGGAIEYRTGDAATFDDAPQGDSVIAVCDPPYYLTQDYQQNTILGLDLVPDNWSYAATRNLLKKLVDFGTGIVYTDEAWWLKDTYTPDTQMDMFAAEQKSLYEREQDMLLSIVNLLDHFDVAGRVAGRQETLGVQHGHTNRKPTTVAGDGSVQSDQSAIAGGAAGIAEPALPGMAAESEGRGGTDGQNGGERGSDGEGGADRLPATGSIALAREAIIADITDSAASAAADADPSVVDSIVRNSVRRVRADRLSDYAQYWRDHREMLNEHLSSLDSSGTDFLPVPERFSVYKPDVSPMTKKEIDRAVEFFGVTQDPKEAAYILPDGRWLDYEQMGEHWEISQAFGPKHLKEADGLVEFSGDAQPYVYAALKAGLIRVTGGVFDLHGSPIETGLQIGATPGPAAVRNMLDFLDAATETYPSLRTFVIEDINTDQTRQYDLSDPRAMGQIRRDIRSLGDPTSRFSVVTPADDAAYLDAVNAGDMETAQRMVRKAAKNFVAGSAVTGKVWHSTKKKFTVFKNHFPNVFFFAKDKGWAIEFGKSERYAKPEDAKPYYITLKNPLDMQAEQTGTEWLDYFKQNGIEIGDAGRKQLLKSADEKFPGWAILNHDISEPYGTGYRDSMVAAGFDGAIFQDTVHGKHDRTTYGIFNSSQVKSADPVTRDDAGNVIPLSQRFNTQNADIRFSITQANYDRWNSILDDYEAGKISAREDLQLLDSTPAVLQRLGVPNLPITIRGGIIKKITGEIETNSGERHGIPVDELRKLQLELDNPIAVFDSGTRNDSLVVLTRLVDRQNNERAVVAVRMDVPASGKLRINVITSAYGKNKSAFETWIANGRLRYINKQARKESARWLQLPGDSTLRARRVLTEKDFSDEQLGHIIPYSAPESQEEKAENIPGDYERASLQAGRSQNPRNPEDVAIALFAARFLGGRETKPEDADRILKNLRLDKVNAADALDRARSLAETRREYLAGKIADDNPSVIAELADFNRADRIQTALREAITQGARAADPDIGSALQKAIAAAAARELASAKGFTARDMETELPISLADAIFAVGEYRPRQPRQEDKTASTEESEPASETADEIETDLIDGEYRAPTAEEQAYFDELMDRAKLNEELRQAEERRKATERAKRSEAQPSAEEDETGETFDHAETRAVLPFDTVQRIAPVFESPMLFAQFVIQWTMDRIVKAHPEIVGNDAMWKNPVAIKELTQTAQHILFSLATDTMGSPNITSQRNEVDNQIIHLADFKTYPAIRRHIAHIYRRIHDEALRYNARKLVKELVYGKRPSKDDPGFLGLRQLAGIKKGNRFSAVQEEKNRSIDAQTELWCRWLIPYLTLSEDAIAEERKRLQGIIDEYNTEDKETGYKGENTLAYRDARDRLALLEKYGGMVRWMPGQIIDARTEILEMVDGRRQAFEEKREAIEADDAAIREAIIAAVEAGATAEYRKEGALYQAFDKYIATPMMGNLNLEMENLLRYCKDPAKRQRALRAVESLSIIISNASARYRATYGDANREIRQRLEEAYGNAEKGIKRLLHTEIPADVAKRFFRQSRDRLPTWGHLLQLYAVIRQKDYRENAELHNRIQDLEGIKAALSAEDLKFYNLAVEWYSQNRQTLSDAVEEITGLPVTAPDRFYTPARMERQPDGFSLEAIAWSPVPSALNRRIRHTLDFDEKVNFLACMNEQAEVRAQIIGYGAAGIRLRDTIAHHDVQAAVRKHVGRNDMKVVADHVKDVLTQGAQRKNESAFFAPLNWARGMIARFFLSGNALSAAKQLASRAVWANLVGFKRANEYYLSAASAEGRAAIKELIDSDHYRARYTYGWSEETQNILMNPSEKRVVRAIEKVYDKGMVINKAVDAVSCLWMAQGFYRDAVRAQMDQGYSLEDAKERAMALTWSVLENGQQSGRIENMNILQRRHGAPAAAMFQFMTAYLLQNNYELQAIREVKAGTPGAKGKLLRAIIINHILIPGYVELLNIAWRALMGDEPIPEDEDEWPQYMKDLVWSFAFGPAAPLYLYWQVGKGLYSRITGSKRKDYGQSAIPAEGIIRPIDKIATLVLDLGQGAIETVTPFEFEEEVTMEKIQEDLLQAASATIAPVRHINRAVKNWKEK